MNLALVKSRNYIKKMQYFNDNGLYFKVKPNQTYKILQYREVI